LSAPLKTLVIGIGNEYRQDDRIGLLVARQLKQKHLPQVQVAESSGEVTELMELWEGMDRVIAVDALSSGAKAGALRRFEAHHSPLPTEDFRYSTHAFTLGEAIELARALGSLPSQMVVYGIEGKNFAAGEDLSPEVAGVQEKIVEEILKEIPCTKPHS